MELVESRFSHRVWCIVELDIACILAFPGVLSACRRSRILRNSTEAAGCYCKRSGGNTIRRSRWGAKGRDDRREVRSRTHVLPEFRTVCRQRWKMRSNG